MRSSPTSDDPYLIGSEILAIGRVEVPVPRARQRVVLLLGEEPTAVDEIEWFDWERPSMKYPGAGRGHEGIQVGEAEVAVPLRRPAFAQDADAVLEAVAQEDREVSLLQLKVTVGTDEPVAGKELLLDQRPDRVALQLARPS